MAPAPIIGYAMSISDKWREYEVDIRPGHPLTGVSQSIFYAGATAALLLLDKADDTEATLRLLLAEVRGYAEGTR